MYTNKCYSMPVLTVCKLDIHAMNWPKKAVILQKYYQHDWKLSV